MADKQQGFFSHQTLEKNIGWMIIASILVVSFAGLVQIVPLFFQHSTTQPVAGVEPYSPLRLMGRDVYIREGCVGCHSQQVRLLAAEVQRYGSYSLASESVFDHPFLWGSKRTGPDLARVGERYSDDWHRIHLRNPRKVVPESNMPAYPWLEKTVTVSYTHLDVYKRQSRRCPRPGRAARCAGVHPRPPAGCARRPASAPGPGRRPWRPARRAAGRWCR